MVCRLIEIDQYTATLAGGQARFSLESVLSSWFYTQGLCISQQQDSSETLQKMLQSLRALVSQPDDAYPRCTAIAVQLLKLVDSTYRETQTLSRCCPCLPADLSAHYLGEVIGTQQVADNSILELSLPTGASVCWGRRSP